jgi:hypothetical protein
MPMPACFVVMGFNTKTDPNTGKVFELRRDHLWGNDDPLFPATAISLDSKQQFAANGLARKYWASADSVQKIFKQSFEAVGLQGFVNRLANIAGRITASAHNSFGSTRSCR